MTTNVTATALEPIRKLTKDLKTASTVLTRTEARFLVDAYYTMQNDRIRSANQVRSLSKDGEPCEVLEWLFDQTITMEKQISRALTAYAEANFVGNWAMSVCGIGGVLSAGLLAHIEIEPWRCCREDFKQPKCSAAAPCTALCRQERIATVGHIWNFAGLNPEVTWNKGERRPFNAKLKVLCWKIGQSFVKVSSNQNDFYGKIYLQRKQYETAKNEKGEYSERARHQLATKNYGRATEAYKYLSGQYDPFLNRYLKLQNLPEMTLPQLKAFLADEKKIQSLLKRENGSEIFDYLTRRSENFIGIEMLPPGQIQLRSERYAVKLFLSHWHEVAYRHRFSEPPPKPYAISILGHSDRIEVPNNPF